MSVSEVEQIQSAICDHEQVCECVILGLGDGHEELIAFITSDVSVSSLEMRAYLRHVLPDHRIPSRFIQMDTIPLTIEGEPDFDRLRSLAVDEQCEDSDDSLPLTPSEVVVTETVRNTLHVSAVDLRDTFFDAGGYSSLAIGIIDEIEAQLCSRISLMDLFTLSLRQVAATCDARIRQTAGVEGIRTPPQRDRSLVSRLIGIARQIKWRLVVWKSRDQR